MEIDRQLLYPAFYYAHTSDMPVSLTGTAWLCVKMYTSVEHDLCPTCYERPPVLSDPLWWAEGVVAQDRFYCISKYTENFIKSRPSSRLKSVCLSQLKNCRSQFLLDRLGRCLKLFISTESTSCHESASQFVLEYFLYSKNTQNYREY